MMKRFRTLLFWCHLAIGVAAGAIVLVMSVTGVLLTYQRQITTWADLRGLDGAPPSGGAARLPVAELVARIPAGEPAVPTAITFRPGLDAPVQVAFGRERTVFVNAYTGAVLGEGNARVRGFFRWVTDWHRWLGRAGDSREWGKAVTGAANLGFLLLVVSGFYLWWPRNLTLRTLRSVLWFRRGLSGKARDFNWHNAIGFWSVVPLFVIVLSGVVISYRWAGDLVYRAAGEAPPPAPAEAGRGGGGGGRPGGEPKPAPSLAGLDAMVEQAGGRMEGWRTITLQVPPANADTVRLTLDAGSGGEPQKRAQLTLARATGDEVRWEPFSAATPGRRARMILRFAHTGEVLGLVGQTIAGIASLGAVILVWTGIALALRRLASWRARRRTQPQAPPSVKRRRRESART